MSENEYLMGTSRPFFVVKEVSGAVLSAFFGENAEFYVDPCLVNFFLCFGIHEGTSQRKNVTPFDDIEADVTHLHETLL